MSARLTRRHAWHELSGFLAIPVGVAGLFLAAPLLAGAASPGLTAVPRSGSPPPSVNPCVLHLTAGQTITAPPPIPAATTPAPSPSASTAAPDVLCVAVASLDTSGDVAPGGQAGFAIWVWLAGTVDGTATISLTAEPSTLVPSFTVCPSLAGGQCALTLTAGQPVEVQAAIAVPASALGDTITLTAAGTSPQAADLAAGSASVVAANPPSPTPTPTPTHTPTPKPTHTHPAATPSVSTTVPAPAGVGLTLPPGTAPGSLPNGSLPLLPSPVTNPGVTFPKVTPGPSTGLPAHQVRVTDVSASFPLDTRLIGGQLAGLAVLAAAVTIALARLSLRRPSPQHSKDPQASKDPAE